jgi:hypothetical protein
MRDVGDDRSTWVKWLRRHDTNVARASDPTLPALNNFKARFTPSGDALTIQQFGGELSGGKFKSQAGEISEIDAAHGRFAVKGR